MKFIKRIDKAFHTRAGSYIFFVMAAAAFTFLYGSRWAYGWIAELYPLGDKFVPVLFCVITLCAAATLIFLLAHPKAEGRRALRAIHTVFCVLTGVLFVYTTVLLFGFDKGFDPTALKNGFWYLLPNLPFLFIALGLFLPFAIFQKTKKAFIAILIGLAAAAILAPVLYFILYPPLKFTPSPEKEAAPVQKHSIADYKIVYSADASPAEINAANILANYLSQITGLDYVAEQGVPTGTKEILIGQISGLDVSQLGEEGFIIQAQGESILIAGGHPRGTLYGVYYFLEEYFDCRWYTRELRVIPEGPAEIADVKTERFVPPIAYRQTDWLTRQLNVDDYSFSVANGLNDNVARDLPEAWGGSYGYYGSFCHTMATWFLNPGKYFGEHPEWYSWREDKGTRVPRQICLTNAGALAQMIVEVKEALAEGNEQFGGERFILSITQDDNYDFCQCPDCKAVDEAEGFHSGNMINFINAVAEAIADEYPNVLIDTFAYQYTRTPPKTVKPRENVIVRLCSIECCFAHPLDDPDCPDNLRFANDIKTWSEICDKLYIWGYTTNYGHYNVIFPNFQVLQKNMQFYVKHNVIGVYEEGNHQSEDSHSEFNELRGYLLARLMFDPDLDYDTEMNGFLKAYYGGGWQYVRKFIDLISESTGKPGWGGRHRGMSIYISPTDKGLLDLKPNQIRYADMLWEKAIDLAGNEACKQNVLRSQLSWRFWKGCNKVQEFSRLQLPGKCMAANEQLFNDFEAFGITRYHESWAHDAGALKRPADWRGTPEAWH